jgi:hypothetical protein
MAMSNVVPANPMTRNAVQVPLSFLSYEHRTSLTEYAAGFGLPLRSWLVGASLRYHLTDKTENQLLREHGPAGALELELVVGNGGNLFSKLSLHDLCAQNGLKPDDCTFSDLDAEAQEAYRKEGPLWDAPLLVLLHMSGSLQQLARREATDRTREQGESMWGARARLSVGGYLGKALLGLSGGVATVGAAPAQLSYCTALAPVGNEPAGAQVCTPAYLAGYNRTTVLDGRLEWRQAFKWVGANPAVEVVFQRSQRDDVATANDDTAFGLRYLDFELPLYFYVHERSEPGFYAGLRGVLRWWQVERQPRTVELMAGFFISLAYGGAEQKSRGDRFSSFE